MFDAFHCSLWAPQIAYAVAACLRFGYSAATARVRGPWLTMPRSPNGSPVAFVVMHNGVYSWSSARRLPMGWLIDVECRRPAMETPLTHAVTLDFHDTLFQCDEWFQLEVRDLPLRFLEWLGEHPALVKAEHAPSEVTSLYRQLRRTAIESGIEVDSVECVSRICHEIGVAADSALVSKGVDVLMRRVLDSAQPRPGAVDLVRSLRASGVKLGVISNAIHHPFLEWALERFDIRDQFDVVLTSARGGYYKSRVELYQLASELLATPAENTIHIGDSYRFDVIGASNAGMRTVWLNLTGDTVNGHKPDLVVNSLEGLAPLLFETFNLGRGPQLGSVYAR